MVLQGATSFADTSLEDKAIDKLFQKKWTNILIGLLGLFLLGSFFFQMCRRAISDHLIKKDAIITRAVIIDKKNYPPN